MKTKGGFTDQEKTDIIRLYEVERRGKLYIAKLYGRSDYTVGYWLKKWGVKTHPRSVIKRKILEVYGPTKGMTGLRHKTTTKSKIAQGVQKSWDTGRSVGVSKSCWHNTLAGRVQGTWEVAYLQQLLENGCELPKPCNKRHKTPSGTYKPDFEYPDRFVEIKSEFTLEVAKGRMPDKHGVLSDRQWQKIEHVNKTVKPVELVVLSKTEARELFKRANTGVLTDALRIH